MKDQRIEELLQAYGSMYETMNTGTYRSFARPAFLIMDYWTILRTLVQSRLVAAKKSKYLDKDSANRIGTLYI